MTVATRFYLRGPLSSAESSRVERLGEDGNRNSDETGWEPLATEWLAPESPETAAAPSPARAPKNTSVDSNGSDGLRYCQECHAKFPASALAWIAGHWLCSRCRPDRSPNVGKTDDPAGTAKATAASTPRRIVQELDGDEPDGDSGFRSGAPICEATLDKRLRIAGQVAHFGGYGVGCWMAASNAHIALILQGGVIADVATWVIRSLAEFRERPREVAIELVCFVVVIYIVLGSDVLAIPDTPESRGLGFLGFLGTFTVKSVFVAHKMLGGNQSCFLNRHRK